MSSISSIGIGSGVLTSDLIDQLAEAERAPTELRLDRKEAEIDAKLSAVGRISAALVDLRLPSRVLSNPDALSALEAKSTSSNVEVTADSKASTGQYSVEVTELAQAHSISSLTYNDKNATTMGTGTLSFTVGTETTNIDIDATNNTLEGIAAAVNAEEDIGVNASVIDTGSGFVLVFSSQESGADNAIEITVTDTGDGDSDDANGLSQFNFNDSFKHMAEKVVAQDADFTINGIQIERSSNTITDVIDGLSFTLNGKTSGSPATVTVERDSEVVLERVQEFVDKYNEVKNILNELTEYSPDAAASGILLGDSTIRTINYQVRGIMGQLIPGMEGASLRSLAEVGISSDKDTGNLSIDDVAFTKQLNENPDDVIALFADQGRTSDPQVSFLSKSIDTVPGEYAIDITTAATRGELVGTVGLPASPTTITIDDDNNDLTITVDGTASGAITLDNNDYTADELVAHLQQKINQDSALAAAGKSVVVSLDGSNQIVINSNVYGSSSSVVIDTVDTNTLAQLGLDAVAGTDGVDVEGTINGVAATGSGQILTAADGDKSDGIKILVEGSSTGARGNVTYIKGVAEQLVDKLNSFLEFQGIIGAKEDGYKAGLEEVANEKSGA